MKIIGMKNHNCTTVFTVMYSTIGMTLMIKLLTINTFLNILFGLLYVAIGIEQITTTQGSFLKDFLNGFFFSAQTLTTVGYGGITPTGITANFIAAFEAMIGLTLYW